MTDPPGSAADVMALLNSNADGMIQSGNDAVATQFSSIANGGALGGPATPNPVYQSLFSEPVSQVNGGAIGNLLFDVSLLSQFNATVQPSVAQFQQRFNVTAPSEQMPQDFSVGTTPTFTYPGGYGNPPSNPNYLFGNLGSASWDPNTGYGTANGTFSLHTPAMGEQQPFESLFGTGRFGTNTGSNGAPKTELNIAWSKIQGNGDSDLLGTTLVLDAGNLTGMFHVATRRGPLSLSGRVLFTNSVVTEADSRIDYVTPEEQFHLTYRYTTSLGVDPHRELYMSYVNQRTDNVALMSDFAYNSDFGTKSAAGVKYWNNERDYLESIVTHTQPLTGSAHTAALFRGAMKSRLFPEQSLIFNYALVNGQGTSASTTYLVPYLEVSAVTPLSWHTIFIQDYDSWKNSTPAIGVRWNY